VQQFTFGVQQQVAQNFTVSADAVHNFGSRFLIGRFLRQLPKGADANFLSCPNSIDPCTIIDPASGKNVSACFTKASDPTCDQVTNIESSAKTWYDALHRFVFYGQFNVPWQIKVVPSWIWASHVPMDCRVAALSARLPNIPRNACGEQIPDGAALNSAITAYNALPTCTGAIGGPVP